MFLDCFMVYICIHETARYAYVDADTPFGSYAAVWQYSASHFPFKDGSFKQQDLFKRTANKTMRKMLF